MRPLYLEMTAFGSYAEKTALPFEELRHGLYLVTGDTGAGKTTIFDAIMFALFGVASGSDRTSDMLHCDYVPKSVDTAVKLRFSQNGKEYTVERRIHFSKVQGTKDQYRDGKPEALLTEPDAAPIEGAKKVTDRCEELLGLNAEQFSRIVMLAQGEFKKFLKANSDEKNEILGKLFDHSVYVYYQNLLLEARDALSRRRGAALGELKDLMEKSFRRPEGFPDGEAEAFLPGHPALLENLRRLTDAEADALAQLTAERDEALKALGELNRRLGEGKAMNALLEELAQAQRRLAELEALDGEMRRRRERLDRVDTALHTALPAVRGAERAETELNLTLAEAEDLRADLAEVSRSAAEAEAAVKADESAANEKRELERRIHSLEEQFPLYAALNAREREKTAAEQTLVSLSARRSDGEAALEALKAELAGLRENLDALGDAPAALARCQSEEAQAAARLDALCGKSGLGNEVEAIRALERGLESEKDTLLALTVAAGEASAGADALYQKFVAAQAALLADGLRRTLTENEEAACPVCGTHLHRHDLAQLARLPEETPDKEAVDAARGAAERAERERSRQNAAVESLGATISTKKQAAAERAAGLLANCDSWEALTAEGALSAAAAQAQERAAQCRDALRAAEEKEKCRDTLRLRLPQKERALQELQEQLAALREQEQTQQGILRAAKSAIDVLRAQLLADETAAREEKARLEARAALLTRQIQTHLNALEAARSRRDTILGSLTEKENAAEKQTAARDEALLARDRVLEQTGFPTAEAVGAMLQALPLPDAEAWIGAERTALAGHELGKNAARELIETRRKQTEGREEEDLDALEAARRQLSEKHAALNDSCAGQESLLANHRAVRARAESLKRSLSDSDRAWKRLDALGSLAGGASSEGGKLSFDRYVMGTMFREILEMANRRLELMSGGRYELVHKVGADRKNAKAGLEIEVLDNNTGLQRASGSLSGGESFFTSLSLALGLSDVVQNHAGGRQMDALFIDEGFGTLSDDVLDKALDVLNQLTEGNRLVGIISHVDKLDESIPQKIRVRNGEKGSSLSLELA